jgi:hypothetical protein
MAEKIAKISTIEDLLKLREKVSYYDSIVIITRQLKYKKLLRFAFKYALSSLKVNGSIKVVDESFVGYEHALKRIDFWQVKAEFYICAGRSIHTNEIDYKNGVISATKVKDTQPFKGISFGVIVSGDDSEIARINELIDDISSLEFNDVKHEIIICGPKKNKISESIIHSPSSRYLNYDDSGIRFLVGKKKNFIYSNCRFDMVVMMHLRIKVTNDIIALFHRDFDFCTTKVLFRSKGVSYPYLDYILVSSYDMYQVKRQRNIFKKSLKYCLKNYANRVPYIDGGLNIFNKNNIVEPPYSNVLEWGEAEDLDLACRLYHEGNLIDYYDDLVSYSLTDKIHAKDKLLKKATRRLVRGFGVLKIKDFRK